MRVAGVLLGLVMIAVSGCRAAEAEHVATRRPVAEPAALEGSGGEAGAPIRFEVSTLRIARGRLPLFASLRPAGQAAYAVVRAGETWVARERAAARNVRWGMDVFTDGAARVEWLPSGVRFEAAERRRAVVEVFALFSYWGGGALAASAAGPSACDGRRVALEPMSGVARRGERLEVLAALADEGRTVVFELVRRDAVRRPGADLPLPLAGKPEPLPLGSPWIIPAVAEATAGGRFALREGEALVLLEPSPAAEGEALVTVVTWAAPEV